MAGSKIIIKNGETIVPDFPVIPFIKGDGVGSEIWDTAVKVFDYAVEKAYGTRRKIEWLEAIAGKNAFDLTGEWLPQKTVDVIDQYKIAIRGPLTIPVGGGIRSLNVALRQKLDLYTGIRPIRYFPGIPSPLRHPDPINMTIFRENTEGMYAGFEVRPGSEKSVMMLDFFEDEFPEDFNRIHFGKEDLVDDYYARTGLEGEPAVEIGMSIKPVSRQGMERFVRTVIRYALRHKRKSLTLVHKGNIMRFTEGAFRDWGYALADREFRDQVYTMARYDRTAAIHGVAAANEEKDRAISEGKLLIRDLIVNFALQMIQNRAEEFDVIAALNLNGEYLTDLLIANTGTYGIAPAAHVNYDTGHAIFEVTHGTAMAHSGQNMANPVSMLLAGVMMLEHLGWQEAADLIREGVAEIIARKKVTKDLFNQMEGATLLTCREFGEAVVKTIGD